MKYTVFYAGLLYGEFPAPPYPYRLWKRDFPLDLPDGAYLHTPEGKWFRSDYTPVLDADVPLELKALCLLLNL